MISEKSKQLINRATYCSYRFGYEQNTRSLEKFSTEIVELDEELGMRESVTVLATHVAAMETRIRELEKSRPRIVVRTWEAHKGPYGCTYDMQERAPNGQPWMYFNDRDGKGVHPDVVEHVLNSALEVLEKIREKLEAELNDEQRDIEETPTPVEVDAPVDNP